MATPAGGIGIETGIVRDGDNERSVAVNVNVTRGRSAPREVYLVSSFRFVATRSEGDLPRGWRRSRGNRSCRCRTWRGSWGGSCSCSGRSGSSRRWRGRRCRQPEGIDPVIRSEVNPTARNNPRVPLARASH